MPTFLTTPKMPAALAARVAASVRGKRATSGGRAGSPRFVLHLVTVVRFGVPLAILSLVVTIVHFVREDRRELERARGALLDVVRAESAPLTGADLGRVADVDGWLTRLTPAYAGDLLDPALRNEGAVGVLLARPTLYVRGPLASFGTAERNAEVAAASSKDAFLRCLLDPPVSRSEKAVLSKALTARAAGETVGWNVHRLDDAERVLPFLQPAWAAGVRSAPDLDAVLRQRRQLEKTPVERGVPALKAEILVVVLDEPSLGGPTELDGEGAHDVRVAVVDLAAERILVRVRKHVDPAWISAAKRPMYAVALDGCVLAADVRDALTLPPAD